MIVTFKCLKCGKPYEQEIDEKLYTSGRQGLDDRHLEVLTNHA